ncbi:MULTISPECIES: hypothetical protein [unclassified Bartonella]
MLALVLVIAVVLASGPDVEALEIKADILRKNLQEEACAFT